MSKKRAIILAGGKGTRLKPFTLSLPKPLVPIGNYPIMEIIIRQLSKQGFEHITLAVNHQADIIKAYFGTGKKWNIYIDYSLEEEPLGTMGPLTIINDLPDNFLVMNGDVLTNLDFNNFFNYHVKQKNLFTISSYNKTVKSEFGILEIDNSSKLIKFKEKPSFNYLVSMGIYMLNKNVIQYIPKNSYFGFDQLMLRLIELDKNVVVKLFHGYWLDIGRPQDYETAIRELEKNPKKY